MLHPFAGIVPPGQDSTVAQTTTAQPALPSRRVALGVMAGVATAATTGNLHAAEPAAEQTPQAQRKDGYALYFVEPRELRTFTQPQRAALGVNGPYRGRWPEKHPLQDKRGYLAWLNTAQAAKVKAFAGVADVIPFTVDHVVEYVPRVPAQGVLSVFASPNSWRALPPKGTYSPLSDLVKVWDAAGNATFSIDARTKVVKVQFPKGVEQGVIDTIKRSGQVHAISWNVEMPNTQTLLEEGGATTKAVGEEGGPTTLALGEEGGPGPSTRALGEEGGATTKAVGEEGGPKPTTRAVGEEGGPTTLALGEEGGPVPTTKAVGEEGGPKPSTRALGEEGGPKPTTQALGEEGGPKPSTRALGEEGGGKITTFALGEEGGPKK